MPVIQGDAAKGERTDSGCSDWETYLERECRQVQQRRPSYDRLQRDWLQLRNSYEAEVPFA